MKDQRDQLRLDLMDWIDNTLGIEITTTDQFNILLDKLDLYCDKCRRLNENI